MEAPLNLVVRPERPHEYGLECVTYPNISYCCCLQFDCSKHCTRLINLLVVGNSLVVFHGLHTLGLPRLPSTWSKCLLDLCPENTRIIDHDADLRIEDKFKWGDVQVKTNDLTNALRSWVDDEVKQVSLLRSSTF